MSLRLDSPYVVVPVIDSAAILYWQTSYTSLLMQFAATMQYFTPAFLDPSTAWLNGQNVLSYLTSGVSDPNDISEAQHMARAARLTTAAPSSMWLNCPKTALHRRLLLLRAASSFSLTLPPAAIAAATATAPSSEEVLPWAFSVRPALTPAKNAASEADPPAVLTAIPLACPTSAALEALSNATAPATKPAA